MSQRISSWIKANPRVKKLVHWMLIPSNEYRPRLWVKLFVNPFIHKKGKGSKIRNRTRIDVIPFNDFNIGSHSTIEDFCVINNGVGDVIIGNNTIIGVGSVAIGPVRIGDNVMVAQHVVISGMNHNFEDVSLPPLRQNISAKPITIADDVWIGSNAVITAGVTIGKHAIIGAGSIVTKDVSPFSVYVGNPARMIKKYNFNTQTWEAV